MNKNGFDMKKLTSMRLFLPIVCLLAMLVVGDANHFVEIANVQTADVAVVVHGVGIGVPRGKEHDLLHERYLQSNFSPATGGEKYI